ncbi:putative secreted protein [Corynebacterium deserti GIMN1.010]|uniref:Putative secreted protein n=1 Tax=Corynebacterium deserti GIMN1.010 TaxID=931089 RepID=A0A0M4CS02_9CORY|nr:hypothetical protein [Corynebacterium deserti]ALC07005.1 putative secreted protein [Corynebacterium deserti GIMN1.010]
MPSFFRRLATALAVGVTTLSLAPIPAGHAAVGAMLNQLPSGEISCATAEAYWTNDADYQSKVDQAQALAAMDARGSEILDVLARVDAAAENCGLKGTSGASDPATTDGEVGSDGAGSDGAGSDGVASGTTDTAAAPAAGSGGTSDAPVTDAEAVLGPVRGDAATPMKIIEVLGQGQVEVPDANALLSNYLRQLTIII